MGAERALIPDDSAVAGVDPCAMPHVVLLGDSIFDNGAYVPGEPDVIRQVRARLPGGWKASLLAVDGAVTASVVRQLGALPRDASHLVISTGGNDALHHAGVLDEPARSMAGAIGRLATIRERFLEEYRTMLDAAMRPGLPVAVCTIYDARFPDPQRQRLAVAGLTLFNDAITRAAFARGLALIDLRLICNEDADYANPIEPSARGGAKIARAIVALVTDANCVRQRSQVVAW
jgi:hypothetical protein